MTNVMMQQFVTGLKSRNEEMRLKAARDLHHYVSVDDYVNYLLPFSPFLNMPHR